MLLFSIYKSFPIPNTHEEWHASPAAVLGIKKLKNLVKKFKNRKKEDCAYIMLNILLPQF